MRQGKGFCCSLRDDIVPIIPWNKEQIFSFYFYQQYFSAVAKPT